jgi:arginine N-succinyltransferase
MILLREIQAKDLDALERFAQIPGMYNLPGDRDQLKEKIVRSKTSFNQENDEPEDNKFMFIAEEVDGAGAVGTSMIASKHGTESSPHFYFEVDKEERFSNTINTGFIHGTLELKCDVDGPSEIGGLVIDPNFRKSDEKMGRQISFVRFLYMGLNRAFFQDKIIAELLPPLNRKGLSPLWEAIGRRFTNMDYWEADDLCQKSKEFIFSLFPSGKIYTTFLSAEARNAIGKVGKDTEPVLHMLKKIGFEYINQVDPFDGGPHLWANVANLKPIQKMVDLEYTPSVGLGEHVRLESGLLAKKRQKRGEFRAVSGQLEIGSGRTKFLNPEAGARAEELLGLVSGDQLTFMPYYG